MSIRTIVVEDNPMEAAVLEQYCSSTECINVINSFSQGLPALEFMTNEKIDLMFLDMEMPDMSGLEVMETLTYMPQVVITTSNKKYAVDAYDYDVTDFLAKPIGINRFGKTVEKIQKNFEQRNNAKLGSAAKEFYIKSDGKYIRLPYDQILYFENVGDYIKVITTQRMHVIYGALKALAERLQYSRFLKVHRSFIVNMDKIVDIEDNSLVIGEKVIPISRAHKPILMNSINII